MIYAIVSVVSRSVVWTGEADSKEHALQLAVIALDRTRPPAAWDACLVSDLPADLQAQALEAVRS